MSASRPSETVEPGQASLDATLERLAKALPGRIRFTSGTRGKKTGIYAFYVDGTWIAAHRLEKDGLWFTMRDDLLLELALRDECKAREWDWSSGSLAIREAESRYCAFIVLANDPDTQLGNEYAQTSGHALALAFLSASGAS